MFQIGLYHDPYQYTEKDLEMRKVSDELIAIGGRSHDYKGGQYKHRIDPPYRLSYCEEREGYYYGITKEIPDIKEIIPQLSGIKDDELRANVQYLLEMYEQKYEQEVKYRKQDVERYEEKMGALWNENHEAQKTLERLIGEMKKK